MDENDCLVGELRKYLSTAKYKSQDHESEQVQLLKRDLNLAARVGQQLLMQLKSAEKSRNAAEKELLALKQKNAKLTNENHTLACEHELMVESISQQETEISALQLKLKEAQIKTERLRRATAVAKALEREVHLLEHMQVDLRAELEQRTQQREDAQKLAKHLASSLAQHVASDFEDLKKGLSFDSDLPSLTIDATHSQLDTKDESLPTADTSIDHFGTSFDDRLDICFADLHIEPKETATPLKSRPRRESSEVQASPGTFRNKIHRVHDQPPSLVRSRSHESVFSVIPAASTVVSSLHRLESTALPRAVTALSDEHTVVKGYTGEPSGSSKSARDRLSQIRSNPVSVSDRRRWAFKPFRALQ